MAPGKRSPRHISDVEPDSFGAQLRRLRMERGMSQVELGEAIGADQQRISSYELGNHLPQEPIMLALADALKIPPARFFEATKFEGVLPIGEDRRRRLATFTEDDWRIFDRQIALMGELTPDERARFEEGFARFISTFSKDS